VILNIAIPKVNADIIDVAVDSLFDILYKKIPIRPRNRLIGPISIMAKIPKGFSLDSASLYDEKII